MKNLGKLSGHILSIYKSFNTWACSKYWSNPSKTFSGYFKLLKYLQRKYSLKISSKFYHVTYDIFDDLAKSHVMENRITPWNPLKTISALFQVEQLCTSKLSQILWSLVHMLKWSNKSSGPSSTSWRTSQLDQSAPKPFLSRTKFEQLYIGNFLFLISTFVEMFRTSNDDTTPSGASRRIDLHD